MLQISSKSGKLSGDLFYLYDKPNYGVTEQIANLTLRQHPKLDSVLVCRIDSIRTLFDGNWRKEQALNILPAEEGSSFNLFVAEKGRYLHFSLHGVEYKFKRYDLQDFHEGLFDTFTFGDTTKAEWERIFIYRNPNCIYPLVEYASFKNPKSVPLEVINFELSLWSFWEGVSFNITVKFRNTPKLYSCKFVSFGGTHLYVRDGLGPGKDQTFTASRSTDE